MENIEVINFVEKLKKICTNEFDGFPAKPDNSSIARLLCEEARYRWFGIIEAEDVMTDDISCIIVDFEQINSSSKNLARDRNVKAFQSLAITGIMPHANSHSSINYEDEDGDVILVKNQQDVDVALNLFIEKSFPWHIYYI